MSSVRLHHDDRASWSNSALWDRCRFCLYFSSTSWSTVNPLKSTILTCIGGLFSSCNVFCICYILRETEKNSIPLRKNPYDHGTDLTIARKASVAVMFTHSLEPMMFISRCVGTSDNPAPDLTNRLTQNSHSHGVSDLG